MEISLCITTRNRLDMTIESFKDVLSDDRITEIIIVDDCSDKDVYDELKRFCDGIPKVKLFRNPFRFGMAGSKRKAINLAKNKFACIFDSDNKIGPDYFDALFRMMHTMSDNTICMPMKANPNFDFTNYRGRFINAKNVNDFMHDPMFRCMLNCCNYVVPVHAYLEVYEFDKTIKATDTIAFNYLWLKKGKSFFVVPDMEYFHRVHDGSGFLEDADYNMSKAKEFEYKIKFL